MTDDRLRAIAHYHLSEFYKGPRQCSAHHDQESRLVPVLRVECPLCVEAMVLGACQEAATGEGPLEKSEAKARKAADAARAKEAGEEAPPRPRPAVPAGARKQGVA